jgi:mercuric ion transport protein
MRRDRWLVVGVIGAALACLARFTPALVVVLGAIGLGTLAGRLDWAMLPLLLGFAGLAAYRYGRRRRRTP